MVIVIVYFSINIFYTYVNAILSAAFGSTFTRLTRTFDNVNDLYTVSTLIYPVSNESSLMSSLRLKQANA